MTKAKLTLCNEAKLHQEEKERLRKLRLIQVREISKQNAAQLREAFRKEKDKGIQNVMSKINMVAEKQKQNELDDARQNAQAELKSVGSGHSQAANYTDQSSARLLQAAENGERASQRGRLALLVHRREKSEHENKENAHVVARQQALEVERTRAAQIAHLPKPVDELAEIVAQKQPLLPPRVVTLHSASLFMNTRYHMPETLVDKASSPPDTQLDDARLDAAREEAWIRLATGEKQRTLQERQEKARLRGKRALEKEILSENYADIMRDLSVLQKADREKRQKELGNIPKEIFLPAWQREQEKNELQLELERQFEKIYVDSNLRKEEMPEPEDINPMMSASSLHDNELDLTLVENEAGNEIQVVAEAVAAHPESEPRSIRQQQTNFKQKETTAPAPAPAQTQVLKIAQSTSSENAILSRLLDKIKKQREEISQKATQTSQNAEASLVDSATSAANEKQRETIGGADQIDHAVAAVHNNSNHVDDEYYQYEERDSISLTLTSEAAESEVVHFSKQEKNIIRNIMMSSHNVSSVNEMMDSNRQRQATAANFRNADAYSVDLSHVSRDPILAGPRDMFNRYDKKQAIEQKQKQLQKQQEELEDKLRQLEEQEAQLEKEAQIEERKRAIMKTFDIHSSSSASHTSRSQSSLNSLPNPQQQAVVASEKQMATAVYKPFIYENDKHSTADSGFASGSSSNQFNYMSLMQHQKLKRESFKKQPINLAVEQLNTEIILNASRLSALNLKSREEELALLKRRLSSASASSSSTSSAAAAACFSQTLDPRNHRQLGLELYDSAANLSDLREPSIEKLIGYAVATQKTPPPLQQQQAFSKLLHELSDSDNTLHDQDELAIEETTASAAPNNADDELDEDEDEDSQALIMSLLKSSSAASKQQQQQAVNVYELKRQFVQEQLEAVRKQKEQLILQQQHQLMPPPIKPSKVDGHQVHELSTIKEVDTPMSERNLKSSANSATLASAYSHFVPRQLNPSNTATKPHPFVSKPCIPISNLATSSSSSLTSTSDSVPTFATSGNDLTTNSLENVTQLNNNNSSSSLLETGPLSPSQLDEASCCSAVQEATPPHSATIISSACNAHQTLTTAERRLLSLDTIRTRQAQLFNISLFDSSAGSHAQSLNPAAAAAAAAAAVTSDSPLANTARTDYAQMIFDSLLTNQLSITSGDASSCSTSDGSSAAHRSASLASSKSRADNKPRANNAFRTESTATTNKKWFDILASASCQAAAVVDSVDNGGGCNRSSIESNNLFELESTASTLSQGRLSATNDSSSNNSFLHSLNQEGGGGVGAGSGLDSVSASVLINDDSVVSPEPLKSVDKTLEMVNGEGKGGDGGGMFDRFLKSFSLSGTQANAVLAGQSQSVMDEPEISFVSSCRSTPPHKKSVSAAVAVSRLQSCCTDYSSNATTVTESSDTNKSTGNMSSLIQRQQRQLSEQFANISPITSLGAIHHNRSDSVANLKEFSTISLSAAASIAFEGDCSSKLVTGRLSGKEMAEEEEEVEEESESSCSTSLIEGRLSGNSFDPASRRVSKTTRKTNSSIGSRHQLTMVSPLLPPPAVSSSTSGNNSNSLLSFEQHEVSQTASLAAAALRKGDKKSCLETIPSRSVLSSAAAAAAAFDESMLQNMDEEKLKVFKEKFNSQSPLLNSTPMLISTKSIMLCSGSQVESDSTILFSF